MLNTRFNCIFLISLCALLTACDKFNAADTYRDISGNTGRFSDHQGQWMIINYWAVWCKPCVQEIPHLNDFAKNHRKDAVVFSVNYDGKQGEQLIEETKKLGIEFPTLIDNPSQVLGFEQPSVLPTTLIFNPKGELHQTLVGPQTQQSLEQVLLQ